MHSLRTKQPRAFSSLKAPISSTRSRPSHTTIFRCPLSTTAPASQSPPRPSPGPESPKPRPVPFPSTVSAPSLPPALRQYLESALRVNHAGELAATLIYAAQNPPIVRSHPQLRTLVTHMYDQEKGHFEFFNKLLADKRIRPTAMYPVWQVAATVLGWGTGIMGREAAMACTEAVETEIGGHYNAQVRVLKGWVEEMEARQAKGELSEGETQMVDEVRWLTNELRRIRDEELEHLDHAVEGGAKMAKPYEVLNGVIRAGCRGAIWVSERV